MIDHWEGIVIAVLVGGIAILTKYMFVSKRDCKDMRDRCTEAMCGKIEQRRRETDRVTNNLGTDLTQFEKTLGDMQRDISQMNKVLSELYGAFRQFLQDFDRRLE